jgi:hypothetical protein
MRRTNIKRSMSVIAEHIVKSASKPATYNLGLTSLSDKVSIILNKEALKILKINIKISISVEFISIQSLIIDESF